MKEDFNVEKALVVPNPPTGGSALGLALYACAKYNTVYRFGRAGGETSASWG